MGAMEVEKVVKGHQGWRLISCIWLHAGVFHLLANMISLLIIGIRLEKEFGFIRIGLVYVLSGFGGSLMSALFLELGISVGASGALFGLLGAMLSELITNWTIYANKLAAFSTLVIIVLLNLAVGLLPHVDNFAHIGGYIAPPAKSKYKAYQYVLLAISLTLLITGFAIGLLDLFKGVNVNEHCPWCQYMTCVPTPLWSCKSPEVYCQSSQFGPQLNLTCLSTGKSGTYILPDDNPTHLQVLCSQLCQ
ncbi:unnamed protein product [Linum trigynum]